tara:strand:+ start:893 stop:1189 length:297 start_codon:yes stop_codon:yes gene_type:complete
MAGAIQFVTCVRKISTVWTAFGIPVAPTAPARPAVMLKRTAAVKLVSTGRIHSASNASRIISALMDSCDPVLRIRSICLWEALILRIAIAFTGFSELI